MSKTTIYLEMKVCVDYAIEDDGSITLEGYYLNAPGMDDVELDLYRYQNKEVQENAWQATLSKHERNLDKRSALSDDMKYALQIERALLSTFEPKRRAV
jgi:hypothetical protein